MSVVQSFIEQSVELHNKAFRGR